MVFVILTVCPGYDQRISLYEPNGTAFDLSGMYSFGLRGRRNGSA